MASYTPPSVLFNRHLETIYPSLLRKVNWIAPSHERIGTHDDDFLDLDWYKQGSTRCVIISHGLEGNSSRSYVRGMARALYNSGLDVLAWNFRGCSAEVNRQPRFYHSGATDDLHTVVAHAMERYAVIDLIGFSLGGNLTLKYLGERTAPSPVKRAVTFSVPMDLYTSCLEISKPFNWVYTQRFLKSLIKKVKAKPALRKHLSFDMLDHVRTLLEFDDHFTGPLHGFRDAMDYYTQCSSRQFLPAINVPTLVVNALNDPFLSPACYPHENVNPLVQLEFPERGGHVGFALFGQKGLYWSEMRALSFLESTA